MSFLTPDYKTLNWKTVFLVLFLVAFFIRFPFFFRDYVDRDESTFIIVAQSWVDGHLPYTQLWDLKPPITFLFFALIIKIFGKSFLAIRFFGTLLVALTASFTYGIGCKIASKKVGVWCAVFCVLLQSLFGSLQGVMSEHISVFFFTVGVYLLLSKESRFWHLVIGIIFGLSVMSKLNMAYPLLALGIYFIWKANQEKKWGNYIAQLAVLGVGTALLIVLTALPYYLEGELTLWWRSIFEAPLAYSGSKQHSIWNTLPIVFVVLMLLIAGFKTKIIDSKSPHLQLLTVVVLGVLISFMQAGKVNGHYMIQLYPFLLIPAGIALSKLPKIRNPYQMLVGLLLLLLPMESYLEYANIVSNKAEKGSFFNGEGFDVPNYIVKNNIETQDIFFTEYHIGYWALGENPPTKAATHPSSITRDELFPFMGNPRETAMQELRYILEDVRPKTIVARSKKKVFDKKLVDLNTYIDTYLAEHYTLLTTLDRGLIYQRLE